MQTRFFDECKTRPEGPSVLKAEERLNPVQPEQPARGNLVEPPEDFLEKMQEQSSVIIEEQIIYLHSLNQRDTTSHLRSLVVKCQENGMISLE